MSSASFLFTCDMHNRLTAPVAQRLRELKRLHGALLLDGGDAISASNVTVRSGREPAIDLMNSAGYDAMVIGNREYFVRRWGLGRKTEGAQFPVLAANINFGDLQAQFRPWAIVHSAGLRIGIVGFAREMVPPRAWWGGVTNVGYIDLKAAAERAIGELSPQVDMLVALSHLGLQRNRELARLQPGIDLILAGHDHPAELTVEQAPEGPVAVYGRPYAQAAALIQAEHALRPFEFQATAVKLL